jgi:hypothetical protein
MSSRKKTSQDQAATPTDTHAPAEDGHCAYCRARWPCPSAPSEIPQIPEGHEPSEKRPGGAVVTAYCARCRLPWPCPHAVLAEQQVNPIPVTPAPVHRPAQVGRERRGDTHCVACGAVWPCVHHTFAQPSGPT